MTSYEAMCPDDEFDEMDMMAMTMTTPVSDARVQANRRNAKLSTGPRTEAGKAKSRMNATKHGLKSLTLPRDEDGAATEQDRQAFIKGLGACDMVSTRLADIAFRTCRRLETVLDAEDAAIASRVDAAATLFHEQRWEAFDENIEMRWHQPVKARLRLQSTVYGCLGIANALEIMEKSLLAFEWDEDMGNSFVHFCGYRAYAFEDAMPGWSNAILAGQKYVKMNSLPYLGVDRTQYDQDEERYQDLHVSCPNMGFFVHETHRKRSDEWWGKFKLKQAEFNRHYPKVGPACEEAQAKVLMHLRAEIQVLKDLAQELEGEEEHALNVACEKAKFDPSDEGRLRHRYLVEARRDLSKSIDDTRKAVAEGRSQAAESASNVTPNEPKREQAADVAQPAHVVLPDVSRCTNSDASFDFINLAITPPAPHHRA